MWNFKTNILDKRIAVIFIGKCDGVFDVNWDREYFN